MHNEELYKMIRVAYNYGDDIPDSLIAYGITKFDFMPVVNLYKAGYRVQPKSTAKNTAKSTPTRTATKNSKKG